MSELEIYIQNYFGVNSVDISKLAKLFKIETLAKNDFYTKSGRYCNRLSFVQSGLIRVFANYQDKEVTQWISTKGYFITDLSSLIFQTPARFSIQALTDCTLYTIDSNDYKNIGNSIPNWHELEKLFIAKCFVTLEDRVFSFLSMSAEERYHLFFEQQPELFNQVPLQYIASMLGMTPETFSRIRKKSIS